jgi:hypothetical protein
MPKQGTAPPKAKPAEKSQRERFIETARQLEADETGEAFERAFRKIVPTKSKSLRDQ